MLFRLFSSVAKTPSPLKPFRKQLLGCLSSGEVEHLVLSSPPSFFNDLNLGASIKQLSRFQSTNKRAYERVLSLAAPVRFKPGELMELCVAAAELDVSVTGGIIPAFVVDQIAVHPNLVHFKPRFLSFILSSFAVLGQKEPANLVKEGLLSREDLSQFRTDDFGIVLDSLSVLDSPDLDAACEWVAKELLERDWDNLADVVAIAKVLSEGNINEKRLQYSLAFLSRLAREVGSTEGGLAGLTDQELSVLLESLEVLEDEGDELAFSVPAEDHDETK
jgi:hypothetical protein